MYVYPHKLCVSCCKFRGHAAEVNPSYFKPNNLTSSWQCVHFYPNASAEVFFFSPTCVLFAASDPLSQCLFVLF